MMDSVRTVDHGLASMPTIHVNVPQNVQSETKRAPASLPVVSDSRNALLESIRKGVQLKVKIIHQYIYKIETKTK